MESETRPHATHQSKHHVFTISFVVVIVLLGGLCTFLYYKYQQALHAPSETQQLVSKLSPTVNLPSEAPTLLTIADKTKLGNAELAAQVSNGDQLLVYNQAKQVIVYRPSLGKVVTILSIHAAPTADSAAVTQSK